MTTVEENQLIEAAYRLGVPTDPCTVAGWVWYCDVHDTHGNADSEDEAYAILEAHIKWWKDNFYLDEDEIACLKDEEQEYRDEIDADHRDSCIVMTGEEYSDYGVVKWIQAQDYGTDTFKLVIPSETTDMDTALRDWDAKVLGGP